MELASATSSRMSASPGPGSPGLTPRSKVAKMLADIDDAPTPSPRRASGGASAEKTSEHTTRDAALWSTTSPAQARTAINPPKNPFQEQSDSDEDDEDDIVRRPQGRAARRMLGKAPTPSPVPPQIRTAYDSEDELYTVTPRKQAGKTVSAGGSPLPARDGDSLFVSPARYEELNSDEELPTNPFGSKEKMQSLVARKRAERMAREAEEKEVHNSSSSDLLSEAVGGSQGDAPDPDVDKILSDASRPARKASKRALLEMERETQRMARQQALAHQMRVRKKFTTSDLFAKFNFRQAAGKQDAVDEEITASSAPNSDSAEERDRHPASTPPSSPPTPLDRQKALVEQGALSKLIPVREDSIASVTNAEDDDELPDIADVFRSSQSRKSQAVQVSQIIAQPKPGLKLARFGKKAIALPTEGSDDELDIVATLPAHLQAIDKALKTTRKGRPADSKAIHALKQLSYLTSREAQPSRKGTRPSIDPKALEAQLRRRAKEQARQQQLERIEELRAKGIDVQTTDEREKEAEAFEDLLEKARQDAVNLRKAERTARKNAGEEVVEVSDDEDEDVDYVDSGSEEEGGLVDAEAEEEAEDDEDEDEELDEAEDGQDEDEMTEDELQAEADLNDGLAPVENVGADEAASVALEPNSQPVLLNRRARKSRVVQDEDDEDDAQLAGNDFEEPSTAPPKNPFAAFNFGAANQGLSLMSPTQAFNATMQTPTQATQDDTFDMMHRIGPSSISSLPPTLPDIDTQIEDESQSRFLAGSQVPESQRVDFNWETQLPETPSAMHKGSPSLDDTPGWEPTQDRGLPSPWTIPHKLNREDTLESAIEQETQSTVPLRVSESPEPSQAAPRRGRLGKRRLPLAADNSEDDGEDAPSATLKTDKPDAFKEMKRRQKEALTAVEKANVDREMREMMDEQAEESEDEYAGLGGDDFVAPETDQDREMIDSSHVDVDERALAAHFAERERQRQEEETSKLYKDLTTGGLRRRMGANAFDLDEDEDEIAARRRQMRQMEEAKRRRALLKDDNIANLAHGKPSKGKEAFLKAIADDDGDTETYDVDDESATATQDDSTQADSQQPAALQETSGNKRKHAGDDEQPEHRAPAKQRRTQASEHRKPTSMLEVRESVSFLLEEPHAGHTFGPSALSDSDDEYGTLDLDESDDNDEEELEKARENDGGFAPDPIPKDTVEMPPPRLPASQRRTAPKPAVVDRLSLKRNASSASDSAHGRTAWASGPATGGFKVPSLLRRATTNTASLSSGNSRGVTTPNLSRENSSGGGVKMGGTKKSSLAYQARAEERRAIVEAGVRRREENTRKVAQMRRNSSVLSKGLAGRFE